MKEWSIRFVIGFGIGVAIALLILGTAVSAEFKQRKLVVTEATCERVRWGVASFGLEAALKWARDNGYTSVHIMQARKCLKGSNS